MLMFILLCIGIAYALDISWAIFYVVAQFLMAKSSSPIILGGGLIWIVALLYLGTPWWYDLLFAQSIFTNWMDQNVSESVHEDKMDEFQAYSAINSTNFISNILMAIGVVGMIISIMNR